MTPLPNGRSRHRYFDAMWRQAPSGLCWSRTGSGKAGPAEDALERVEVRVLIAERLVQANAVALDEGFVLGRVELFPVAGEEGALDPLQHVGARLQHVPGHLKSDRLLDEAQPEQQGGVLLG